MAQKELEENKKEQGKFQNKYESIFKDISVQLCELKERCQLLKDENVKEKKNHQFCSELVKERDEELGQVRREYAQLGEEVDIAKQATMKSESKAKRCQL